MEYRIQDSGKTKRIAVTAMLGALALASGLIESRFPLPYPGMRLGVSNIFSMTALLVFGPAEAVSVTVLRIALSFFLSGSPATLACSAGGALLSLPLSIVLYERFRDSLSVPAISVASAFAFNVGQVGAIAALLRSPEVFAWLPPLLICAAVTGFAVGSLALVMARRMSSAPNQ
ncbi:MAG: Gx transporter family protein [Synergistaceae bacterium]|jgi:heptaprenyl diphosphate synthase|nr:Gx transporter family protein [Synergistaceae bacterium]